MSWTDRTPAIERLGVVVQNDHRTFNIVIFVIIIMFHSCVLLSYHLVHRGVVPNRC